ncbi:MAG: hypothetical protein ACD_2C00010G0001 [uncultured bacterium (gcode 4)]|uniref:Uncharacterized protein n=1 Tax=uncultured bacterium (gcode 4) TaxID=1234023 RepID=K2G4W9_9BACT|nr:MAG: hypothetical protein ACD_2C00010G0001 [uncultured bacterium (gcode 4)]
MPKKTEQKSQGFVKEAVHEFKRWELKSWKSWEKVKSPRQAVAIGLSKARKAWVKTPPPKKKTESKKGGILSWIKKIFQ